MSLAQKQKIKQLKHPSIHWQLFQRLSKSRKAFLNLSESFNSLQRLFDLLEFSVSRGLQGFSGYLMCLENWGLNLWQFFFANGSICCNRCWERPPSPRTPFLPKCERLFNSLDSSRNSWLFIKRSLSGLKGGVLGNFNRTHNSSLICDSRYFFQTISRFSKSLHWEVAANSIWKIWNNF